MRIRSLLSLVILVFIGGCVAIGSGKYPGVESSKSYVDCGAMAKQPRMGMMSQISGMGNFVQLGRGKDEIAICFGDMHSYSTYLAGPILPIIPMFGIDGSDEMPPIHIWLFNQDDTEAVLSFSGIALQTCKRLNGFVTDQCEKVNEDIKIYANDVMVLKADYRDVLSLSVQTNNQNSYHLTAKQTKGTFFIFTG